MRKFLLFLTAIIIDQASKLFAQSHLLGNGHFFVAENVSCNPFIAWGIPLHGYWFWLIWLAAILALAYLTLHTKNNLFLVIALAGAVANFIDRVRFDCVIDFIQIGAFPTFNLADVMITVGIGLFVFQALKKQESEK